jgi:molybdenum-dependent DNA-binding transcriptional regulator ModE
MIIEEQPSILFPAKYVDMSYKSLHAMKPNQLNQPPFHQGSPL